MRKNANEKWRRRLSEIQSWLLRRTALYSCSSSGYSSSRSSEGNTMMASSAFVGDTSRPAATRCYIKTCQLQRRFIDFDSSLPYFNRPIVVHQERSDSLCQNCANVWFNEIFGIFQLFYWIRKEKIQVATWLRKRWAYFPFSFETKAPFIFTLLEVNEDVLCANKASGRIFQYGSVCFIIPVFISSKRCCWFQIKSRLWYKSSNSPLGWFFKLLHKTKFSIWIHISIFFFTILHKKKWEKKP